MSSVIGPGAVHTASPWRSAIFEMLGRTDPAEIAIPHGADARLPFVCVQDVAAMIERLLDAEDHSFAVYNTPSETWTLNELAACVTALNKGIRFTFGTSPVSGIPETVDGGRFTGLGFHSHEVHCGKLIGDLFEFLVVSSPDPSFQIECLPRIEGVVLRESLLEDGSAVVVKDVDSLQLLGNPR